jgi:hypothetical protein
VEGDGGNGKGAYHGAVQRCDRGLACQDGANQEMHPHTICTHARGQSVRSCWHWSGKALALQPGGSIQHGGICRDATSRTKSPASAAGVYLRGLSRHSSRPAAEILSRASQLVAALPAAPWGLGPAGSWRSIASWHQKSVC